MTVRQLLDAAYRALVGEDDATVDLLSNGMEALNALLNEWSTHRWGVYKVTEEALTLTASDGEYSIGSGADLNTARPIRVLPGSFIRISSTDYPLEIVSRERFNRLAYKTLEGIPWALYYEPTYANGTLKLYPEPAGAYSLYLNSIKSLSAYTALTNSLGLPPEYETALKWNVAVEWAPELSIIPSQIVMGRAAESLRNLKRLHSQPIGGIDARPFRSVEGASYDITGDVIYP